MRTFGRIPPIKRHQIARMLRYLLDSVLACAGSLLVTGVLLVFHLYSAIPNISILYLNALEYAPVEQPISVRLDVEANSARVLVRDQGPGLTPEQQLRVWERYYQVAAPGRQGPEGGLGLGLAIAKAIVEQHLGQVGVESAPGHGATFWFALPLEA